MQHYRVPMIPAATRVPPDVLRALAAGYGFGRLEFECFELYSQLQQAITSIVHGPDTIAIMIGGGTLANWSGIRSCLLPGDRVLAIDSGFFARQLIQMARAASADVDVLVVPAHSPLDPDEVEEAIAQFRPKMVTMVHCESQSGILTPVDLIGRVVRKYDVPLFCVDAVSTMGGAELRVDEWNIDICVGNSHKCLSAPPGLGIVSVSERAWKWIEAVDYQGYEALLPWRNVVRDRDFPQTPEWHGLAALGAACGRILSEGLEQVLGRHVRAAAVCRTGLAELGLELVAHGHELSPTMTVVKVPDGLSWSELDVRLRRQGVVVGAGLRPDIGKVFRLGHMGTQADEALVGEALDALRSVVLDRQSSRFPASLAAT